MKMRRRIGLALVASLVITISPTVAVSHDTASLAKAEEVAEGLIYDLREFEKIHGRYQYDWDNARNVAGFAAGSHKALVKAGQRATVDLVYSNEFRNPSNVIPDEVTFSLREVPEGWDATVDPSTGQLSISATNTDPATSKPATLRIDALWPDGQLAGLAFADFALETQSAAYSHLVVEPVNETPFEIGESRLYTVRINRDGNYEDAQSEPLPANAEVTVERFWSHEDSEWEIDVDRQNGTFRVTARESDVWLDPFGAFTPDELLDITVTFPDQSEINEVIEVNIARDSTRADVIYPETVDSSALGVEQTIYPSIQRVSGPANPVKPVKYELINAGNASIDSQTGAITFTLDPDAAPGDYVFSLTIDATFPDTSVRRTSAYVNLPQGENTFLYDRPFFLLDDPVEVEPFVYPRNPERPTPLASLKWALQDPSNAIAGAAIDAKTGLFTAPAMKKSGYYREGVNLYVDGKLDADGSVYWETLERLDARAFRYRYEDNWGSADSGLRIPQSLALRSVGRYVTVTGSSIDTSLITVTKHGLEIEAPNNVSDIAGKEQWVDVRIAIPGEPVQTQRVPFSFYRSLFGFPVALGVTAGSQPSTFASEYGEWELGSEYLILDTGALPNGLTATLANDQLTVSASDGVEPGEYTFDIRINPASLPAEGDVDESLLNQIVETVTVSVAGPTSKPPATTPTRATPTSEPAKPSPTDVPAKPTPTRSTSTTAPAKPTPTRSTSTTAPAKPSPTDAPTPSRPTDTPATSGSTQPSAPSPTSPAQNESEKEEGTPKIWKIILIILGVTTALFGSFGIALTVVPGLKEWVNDLLKPTGFQIP